MENSRLREENAELEKQVGLTKLFVCFCILPFLYGTFSSGQTSRSREFRKN